MFSAKHQGIDGPSSGSDHSQRGAKDRQYDGDDCIAGGGERDVRLNNRYDDTRNWSPQAGDQQNAGKCSNTLRHVCRASRSRVQAGNAAAEQRSSCEQPLEEKPPAGPTVGER